MGLLILAFFAFISGFIAAAAVDRRRHPSLKIALPLIGIVLAVILAICACISYVPTGYTGIVTTFGKVHDEVLDAGIKFHAPWDNVIKMDNREQKVSFSLQAFSSDIQEVSIAGSVNLNINKTVAMDLYKNVGTDYLNIIAMPRILEDVKTVFSQYTAENLIAERNTLSIKIANLLSEDLKKQGLNIISVAIEDVDFSDAYTNSVEAKQVATQEKQRAQTQQEQQTMEATQKAERDRIAAQAAADVAKIEADAKAYAIQVEAEAKAEANKKMNQSLTPELIEYTKINTWNGQLPTITGGATPIINLTEEGE